MLDLHFAIHVCAAFKRSIPSVSKYSAYYMAMMDYVAPLCVILQEFPRYSRHEL